MRRYYLVAMKRRLTILIIASILCSCNKGKNVTVWNVSFVDTSITMNDGHYLFSSSYIELPSNVTDSTIAVDIFYENNSESNVYVYESYRYKSLQDFNNTNNIRPIEDREFQGKENIYKQLKLN
tara:strand:- start:1475 stop:1846 length:372 start_codon:yes stop_codon:yes gene_type:complete